MTSTVKPTAAHVVAERLRSGYERQDPVGMGKIYADDATWELHVGGSYVRLRGRPAIVDRYAEDLPSPATLLRWDVRVAPWGAVIEADALQGQREARVRYRWVHLLTIEQDLITGDTIYCTGAVPHPTGG